MIFHSFTLLQQHLQVFMQFSCLFSFFGLAFLNHMIKFDRFINEREYFQMNPLSATIPVINIFFDLFILLPKIEQVKVVLSLSLLHFFHKYKIVLILKITSLKMCSHNKIRFDKYNCVIIMKFQNIFVNYLIFILIRPRKVSYQHVFYDYSFQML